MILIGIGANLEHPRFGSPRDTCEAALAALGAGEVEILRRSGWYESAPVPQSDQPWFVNGVAELAIAMLARRGEGEIETESIANRLEWIITFSGA